MTDYVLQLQHGTDQKEIDIFNNLFPYYTSELGDIKTNIKKYRSSKVCLRFSSNFFQFIQMDKDFFLFKMKNKHTIYRVA